MFDPLQQWRRQPLRIPKSETEILDVQDRVAFAAPLIRDHELRLWFERDEALARQIAAICPECKVFTIPGAAMMIDGLNEPPAWRRRYRRSLINQKRRRLKSC